MVVVQPRHRASGIRARRSALASEPSAAEVYGTMAERAFDSLAERLRAAFRAAIGEP
jgi:rubrerythrin